MKYYIIAGEASGDLHGSNLILALKEVDPEAEFRVWGGDKMEAASRNLVMHFRKHAFMGLFPVLWNLRTIQKNFKLVENDLHNYNPDALILIDYSGFNQIGVFNKKTKKISNLVPKSLISANSLAYNGL